MQLQEGVLAVLALLIGATSALQFRTDFASSSCSQLKSMLNPLQNLKLMQLQGRWVTVTKGSFGYLDSSSESEFIVNSTSHAPLRTVPDCIRHNLSPSPLTHSLTLTSEYFFEESALNTVMNATYRVMPGNQGTWVVINSTEAIDQDVTFLVLQALPSSHMVLATCRDHPSSDYDAEDEVTTVLHILAREGTNLKAEVQTELLGHNARLLNKRKFLAAELSTSCVSPTKTPVSSDSTILDFNAFFTVLILLIVHLK